MKRNNKGFTLAEMLIVVAIIGVLVGIMTVTISNSLEKAREATDAANIRSALSRIYAASIEDSYDFTLSKDEAASKAKDAIGKVGRIYLSKSDYKGYVYYTAVELKQKTSRWQSIKDPNGLMIVDKYLTLTSEPLNKIFYFGIDQNGSVKYPAENGNYIWGVTGK